MIFFVFICSLHSLSLSISIPFSCSSFPPHSNHSICLEITDISSVGEFISWIPKDMERNQNTGAIFNVVIRTSTPLGETDPSFRERVLQKDRRSRQVQGSSLKKVPLG